MVERRAAVQDEAEPKVIELPRKLQFVSSGSKLFDLVLGHGWPSGRIVNVVGDRSSFKTGIAIEACANYVQVSGPENVRYAEAEAAFDLAYARTLGMPEGVTFSDPLETVEEFYEDLLQFLERLAARKNTKPALYVLDSLDALSDEAEMAREIDKGSYGAGKARKLSEVFRRIVRQLEATNCTLFVISQIRDKLNVTFGETKTRSGGRALDFYCSIIVWLAEVEKIKRSVMGAERVIGVVIHARTKKNKVAPTYRDCDLSMMNGYGILDASSMLNWLKKNKVPDIDFALTQTGITNAMRKNDHPALRAIETNLAGLVKNRWEAIEEALAPTIRKYE